MSGIWERIRNYIAVETLKNLVLAPSELTYARYSLTSSELPAVIYLEYSVH